MISLKKARRPSELVVWQELNNVYLWKQLIGAHRKTANFSVFSTFLWERVLTLGLATCVI
jgi:hypothetical protein